MAPAANGELRRQIVDAAARLVESGILTKSNHGNISIRVQGTETFLLTSVSNLKGIQPDDIGLFDLEDKLLDGSVMPTSAEIVSMHAVVYKRLPSVGSVLHTHSPYTTAFAVAGRSMPIAYEPLVRFGFSAGIPIAAYGPRGSAESVENISAVLQAPGPFRGLLLENHGVLTFGQNIGEAVSANMVLEESAEIMLYADSLGGAKEIPVAKRQAAQDRMHAFQDRGGQSAAP
jgi:L-ribulose-5-phosphate 4-epimerase